MHIWHAGYLSAVRPGRILLSIVVVWAPTVTDPALVHYLEGAEVGVLAGHGLGHLHTGWLLDCLYSGWRPLRLPRTCALLGLESSCDGCIVCCGGMRRVGLVRMDIVGMMLAILVVPLLSASLGHCRWGIVVVLRIVGHYTSNEWRNRSAAAEIDRTRVPLVRGVWQLADVAPVETRWHIFFLFMSSVIGKMKSVQKKINYANVLL